MFRDGQNKSTLLKKKTKNWFNIVKNSKINKINTNEEKQ